MIEEIKVLNDGFVKLVDRMGDDYSVIRSARVSTGAALKKGDDKDRGLVYYMYKNKHMTPFEQVTFTFHLRLPLFINQQILRHRSFSFNQESARYKEIKESHFIPESWRIQDTKNKQNSFEFNMEENDKVIINKMVTDLYEKANLVYKSLLDKGIAREQARIVMPVGQYTEIYFTANLRNILHFLDLRTHPHAQKEIRDYADAIEKILFSIEDLKWTMGIYRKMKALELLFQEGVNKNKITDEFEKYLEDFIGG